MEAAAYEFCFDAVIIHEPFNRFQDQPVPSILVQHVTIAVRAPRFQSPNGRAGLVTSCGDKFLPKVCGPLTGRVFDGLASRLSC